MMKMSIGEQGKTVNIKPEDQDKIMNQRDLCPFLEMHSNEYCCVNVNSQTI